MSILSCDARIGRVVLIGASLAALSACTTISTTATDQEFGVPTGETLPTISYDAATDSYSVDDGTGTVTLPRQPSVDTGDFIGYAAPGSGYLWVGESASGDLTASFVAADASASGVYSVGGSVSRMSDGTIPNSGTASFTGTYGAVVQQTTGTHTPSVLISGNAALTADFDAATVHGTITNRENAAAPGTPFADITLESGPIGANGSFSGTASGGEVDATDTTSGGSYAGLFGGDNGSEAAAGVAITHTVGANSYYETGAFIATQ